MANKKQTNGKDPAVLLYTQDFLVGTISMNFEERGKYITLLCMQHQKGKLTLKDLKSVLSDEDVDVAERFPLHADGFYYNTRMVIETENRKVRTNSSRENGAKGGRPPKTTILPNDEPKDNLTETHRLFVGKPNNNPSGTGNETVNDNVNTETEVVYTAAMLERIIDKFVNIDSRFKFHSVMREIDEDYGGFNNLIQMYLPNDISAQNNFNKQLNEYKNGIFYSKVGSR
jgi:hypothetical protein